MVRCRTAQDMAISCMGSVRARHQPAQTTSNTSTACALAEASYLNRTLLFSDKFCMPAWHQLGGTDKDLWRPMDEVFNLSSARKHGRIELHPDPSAFVQQLTPGSSVMYLRDEILTEVRNTACPSPYRPHNHLVQRLQVFEDMEVLVRMHRNWTNDPTVQPRKVGAAPAHALNYRADRGGVSGGTTALPSSSLSSAWTP